MILDVLNEIKNDVTTTSASLEYLYEKCSAEAYPWGDQSRLKEKLYLIGDFSKDPLNKGYTKFDKHGARVANYTFRGDVEQLYESVALRLTEQETIAQTPFKFDGSASDLSVLAQSVATVSQFSNTIADSVRRYNRENGITDGDDNLPSFEKLSSTFLHCHFPQCFIPLDLDIYGKSKHLFHAGTCLLNGYAVSDDVKQELFKSYQNALEFFKGELKWKSATGIYGNFCARTYALCCYIKRNLAGDFNPITLAVTVFDCTGAVEE